MGELSLLRASNLSIGYGRNALLTGINFEVCEGQFIGLVGPNGAGKSTLLLSLLGNIKALAGRITRRANLRIGYVPQRSRIDPIFPISAVDMVRFGAMGAPKKGPAAVRSASCQDAIDALDRVGIKHLADRPLRDLSGGQQQRVLIARALVRKPELLVLDEPTAGMDLPAEAELMDTLTQWNEQFGTTLIVVVHQVGLVAGRVSHLALINKDIPMFSVGPARELLRSETLSELYRAPMQVSEQDGRFIVRGGTP